MPHKLKKCPVDIAQAAAFASMGATNEGIARGLRIAPSTLKKYRKEFPALEEAIKSAKEGPDMNVVSALYKKAVGETIRDKDGKIVRVVPADTLAQIFWLKNRRPLEWRDRREIDASATVEGEVNVKITVVDTKG